MNAKQVHVTWAQFREDCRAVFHNFRGDPPIGVYGVPTGGCFAAMELAQQFKVPVLDTPVRGCLVVDDLIDSGKTMQALLGVVGWRYATVYHKPNSPDVPYFRGKCIDGWIKLPWEGNHGPEDAVVRILQYIGEDPKRDGLLDTPKRVLKALKEMTEGMAEQPEVILERRFALEHDEMVLLKDIPFTSLCEHHMLPFTGTAAVAYIPGEHQVVGLSKLARLVQCFARRLQVQERLAGQVADCLVEHLRPVGAACIIKAEHSCMSCRGAKMSGTTFVTSALRGVLKSDPSARAELMALVG